MSDRPDISDNSWAGDPYKAEGQIDATLDFKNPRQDVPGSKSVQNPASQIGNMFDLGGLKADSSQVLDGRHDDSRQSVPDPDIQGGLRDDGCGIDVDFNAQGSYKYPDFGDFPSHPTSFAGALRGHQVTD